jgi:hypothetical protein
VQNEATSDLALHSCYLPVVKKSKKFPRLNTNNTLAHWILQFLVVL